MKECRKSEELLARYLHGEALLQDRDILEKHLSVCPDCERLYRAVSDVDRLLRDLPGKEVDPPAWLSARILANLPEERLASAWGPWGRWAAGFAAVAACAVAVTFAILRGGVPQEPRVASTPPAVSAPSLSAPSPGGSPPTGEGATVLRSTPGARPKPAEETAVASAPKVQVIQQVKIFFYYPPAQKVSVTGDFNGWDVDGVPMQAAGKPGMWTTELRLPPGVYSYNFIVDGEILLPDPNAPNQMPDGYGGTNSLLLVRG
ncbi:MAG TPA: zf-HC2 domain-containing protein, partial [Candidatus Deferrimicrobiaceae bacterium]